MSYEFYESLIETLDILSDKELMAKLRQGIKEIQEGQSESWEMTKKEMGL
jgi:antitoxin YefM